VFVQVGQPSGPSAIVSTVDWLGEALGDDSERADSAVAVSVTSGTGVEQVDVGVGANATADAVELPDCAEVSVLPPVAPAHPVAKTRSEPMISAAADPFRAVFFRNSQTSPTAKTIAAAKAASAGATDNKRNVTSNARMTLGPLPMNRSFPQAWITL
jgi:hypothetical protein